MLTPTGVTYAQYWSAIKDGNPTHVRFTFLGQNIVLDDSDVYLSSGVNVSDMFNGDTDLVFGRTLSKQITVTFLNSDRLDSLKWTGEFTLEFGVEINGTTNWVTIGTFSGQKPNNVTSAQTIQFTAYDRMVRFDVLADEFAKTLTYPKTVKQIYDAVCTYIGVENVAGDELANIMNRSFASAPAEIVGYTCRDILAWIAEACGCYAKINSAGKVQMVWFTDNTGHAVTGTEEFSVESGDINDGMTWDEADTYTWDEFDNFTWDDVAGYEEALRVDRLYVKQLSSDVDINYPNDYGDNIYSIVENPFLSVSTYSDITSYIAPIYDRLYNFGGYLPVQLECVGNWCVEAGDIITIDVNSFTITFPIFVKDMRWSGAINDAYETTGSNTRQVYSSSNAKQTAITSKKIEMYVTELEEDVENNYYRIRSGIAITSAGVEITGGKYIKMTSGGSLDIKGSTVSISSGSTFDVQATNFEINSTGKYLTMGNWTFNSYGAKYSSGSNDYFISDNYSSVITNNTRGGLFFDTDANGGKVSLYVKKASGTVAGRLYYSASSGNTTYLYSVNTNSASKKAVLGTEANWFSAAYITEIVGQAAGTGRIISLNFSQTYDPETIFSGDRFLQFDSGWSDSSKSIRLLASGEIIFDSTINGGTIKYTTLTQKSSKEIKHDIKPLEPLGDKLDKLKPVTFVYDDDGNEQQRMGLIYEDAVKAMPEICTNNESNKAINYVELIPALLKEIQELRIRVKTLEEREV